MRKPRPGEEHRRALGHDPGLSGGPVTAARASLRAAPGYASPDAGTLARARGRTTHACRKDTKNHPSAAARKEVDAATKAYEKATDGFIAKHYPPEKSYTDTIKGSKLAIDRAQ